MVRRKRIQDDGLNLPPYLLPSGAQKDPDAWKAARFAWARAHDWGPQMLGHLAFFDETLYWHRTERGLTPPMGCVQRYEQRLAGR